MKRFLAMIALVALTACNSTQDLGNPNDTTGVTTDFIKGKHSYDQVWDATVKALTTVRGTQKLEADRSITITEQNKETGTIKGTTGIGLWSWGEVVGVFISPAKDAPMYTVKVQSRAQYKLSVNENDWAEEIIAEIKKNLAETKK